MRLAIMSAAYEQLIDHMQQAIVALREIRTNKEKVDLEELCNLEYTLSDLITDFLDEDD